MDIDWIEICWRDRNLLPKGARGPIGRPLGLGESCARRGDRVLALGSELAAGVSLGQPLGLLRERKRKAKRN